MPRTARLDYPGVVQHVTVRGIEKRVIFHDDADRRDFLQRLARILSESEATCFGFALMPNHVHLIIRSASVPLARVMARLNTGHAVRFNSRHGRVGHLFQNRYHSKPILDDGYLKVAIRYVHRNPLATGAVPHVAALASHPWTGHAELMGRTSWEIVDVPLALLLFAEDPGRARRALRDYMEEPSEAPEAPAVASEPASLADLADVVERAARRFGVPPTDLRAGRRHPGAQEARALAAYIACDLLGGRPVDVAPLLGVRRSAMVGARARGRARYEAEFEKPVDRLVSEPGRNVPPVDQ